MTRIITVKIEKPDPKKIRKNRWQQVVAHPEFFRLFARTCDGQKYYSWSKFKRHQPLPKFSGCNLEEIWFTITKLRANLNEPTLAKGESGEYYSLFKLSKGDQILHELDLLAGRQVFSNDASINLSLKSTLKRSSLMEEAIASSILEGAHTTRQAAKRMLIENRKPINVAEIKVLNNYRTMNLIEADYKNRPLKQVELFELHRLLTKNDPELTQDERGRFRHDKDRIFVGNQLEDSIAYCPPKEKFLKTQMPKFFAFINDEDEASQHYIHPAIKAIIIHFWFAILHPFVDGNGRLARCLFYWYLLKKGYEAIAYIPISTTILKSPKQYSEAYLLSEQDGFNMTYFYDYNLDKISQAIKEFNNYLLKKTQSPGPWEMKLKQVGLSNHRQIRTLAYLLSSKASFITNKSHMNLTGVERITAAKDLKELVNQGWLKADKVGKTIEYHPTEKLARIGL